MLEWQKMCLCHNISYASSSSADSNFPWWKIWGPFCKIEGIITINTLDYLLWAYNTEYRLSWAFHKDWKNVINSLLNSNCNVIYVHRFWNRIRSIRVQFRDELKHHQQKKKQQFIAIATWLKKKILFLDKYYKKITSHIDPLFDCYADNHNNCIYWIWSWSSVKECVV